MLKVNIIAVGKVKEKYFLDGIEEYKKRLSRYCDFKIIEIGEEVAKKENDAEIKMVKEKEGDKILPLIKGEAFSMAIEGKQIDSIGFSKIIENAKADGKELTFIIGGSYGLSDRVKEKCTLLSFSKMTFPHTLFRLILTEQIYRAFTIISGTAYHK
jgi:23S rRNA (pseudouridine1915-N3)-methyltransferase